MAFTVTETLDLEAPLALAFETLADHAGWFDWMPAGFVPVGPPLGQLHAGLGLRVRIAGAPFASRLRVSAFEAPTLITWGGGLGHALRGDHSFRFEATATGTRVTSSEIWSGWLAPLLRPGVAPVASRIGRAQLEGLRRGTLARLAR